MLNVRALLCRLSVLVLLVTAFCVQRAQAQSWTVQNDSGNQVQVDHNPDGTWTVTPEGGEPATYGADNAASMVNDYGISAGDFSSMQSQAGSDDNAASGDSGGGAAAGSNSDSGDNSSAAMPDGGDDNSSATSGDSGGDDSSGNSGAESGGDSGGGDSGGGDSGD
jgi:hypothetical protein